MQSSKPTPPRPAGNRLLAALSRTDFDRLADNLEEVELVHGQTLIKSNTKIDHVYFPTRGMVSLVRPLADGSMIEVGLIGREGVVGTPLVLGDERWTLEGMVQMAGAGFRIKRRPFENALDASADLRELLLRYTQVLFAQLSQTAACNARHEVERRLARWLLMARDRGDGDELRLSHEFLSMMLGIRRAGVTTAVAKLKAAGILGGKYGVVSIRDRPGLEATACECYRAIAVETERLMPRATRASAKTTPGR